MTIKTIFLAVGLGFFSISQAQHLDYNRFELLKQGGMQASGIDLQYDDIKGNAWNADWQPVALTAEDGRRLTDMQGRIDLYKNVVYVKVNDTIFNINGSKIRRIVFDPGQADSTVFQKGVSGPGLRPDLFVQVLASGKLGLLKQRTVEIKDMHDDGPLSTTKAFVTQDYYYLVRASGQVETVKPGKKVFEQEMGDKWKDVSQYAKAKGVSLSDERGWANVLQFYNSL